jgi:hypothetical protein
MGRCLLAALFVVSACDFQAPAAPPDAPGVVIDAPPVPDTPPAADDVAHVQPDDRVLGTGDLLITAPIAIDTSAMMPGLVLPAGVTFAAAAQAGGGPELAILHVRRLEVRAAVRVHGSRPLVVIADAIDVGDLIDAGAHHDEPGPGAMTTGTGLGEAGMHLGSYTDSGGGGGSHGTTGAAGGATVCQRCAQDPLPGGRSGGAYNAEVATLTGGSPGGRSYAPPSTRCDTGAPGAGGGAVQLYARTQITIQSGGRINAGGGGGLGGDQCTDPRNFLAGHGGGAGGAIVLQSPVIDNGGQLAANGGGGGAGGGNGGDGGDGGDAAMGTAAAAGGTASGKYSAAGGTGAALGATATAGAVGPASGNGGGGGGGLGQIVLISRTRVTAGSASPAPIMKMF